MTEKTETYSRSANQNPPTSHPSPGSFSDGSGRGRELDAFDIARELEAHAERRGFIAPQAYYIVGEFSITAGDGSSLYTDEGHLWCQACATSLLAKALPLLPAERREDHFICPTDANGEDSCPHCMACGETLNGSISSYAVSEELYHYEQHPISPGEHVNPRQAVEIAMVLYAAPDDAEAIALGRTALAALSAAHPLPSTQGRG